MKWNILWRTWICYWSLFFIIPPCFSETDSASSAELWVTANKKFRDAKTPEQYLVAAAHFKKLVGNGIRNGYLYYNLGNAYLKAGLLGEAILNYRRAQIYISQYPYLHENLRYARSLCKIHFKTPEYSDSLRYVFFWHRWFTFQTHFYIFLVCYAVLWIVLLLRLLHCKFPFWTTLLLTTMLLLAFGGSAAYEYWQQKYYPAAVLVGENFVVRKGDGEGYRPLYADQTSFAGVEVRVLEKGPSWSKVEFPDQLHGWVKNTAIRLVEAEL